MELMIGGNKKPITIRNKNRSKYKNRSKNLWKKKKCKKVRKNY